MLAKGSEKERGSTPGGGLSRSLGTRESRHLADAREKCSGPPGRRRQLAQRASPPLGIKEVPAEFHPSSQGRMLRPFAETSGSRAPHPTRHDGGGESETAGTLSESASPEKRDGSKECARETVTGAVGCERGSARISRSSRCWLRPFAARAFHRGLALPEQGAGEEASLCLSSAQLSLTGKHTITPRLPFPPRQSALLLHGTQRGGFKPEPGDSRRPHARERRGTPPHQSSHP